jgi:cytochrome c553
MSAHSRHRISLVVGSLLAVAIKCAMGASPRATPAMKSAPATPPCESCHGAHGEGVAAARVPRIAGQSSDYLLKQLEDFSSGLRDNPIMITVAKTMNDAQRVRFAAKYAATLAAPAAETHGSPSQLARGHQLAYQGDEARGVQACNSCHGPDGVGVAHAAPSLAGQSADYLASSLKAFHDGTRKNDAGELMRSVAGRLNDVDIAAVSSYFASIRIDPPASGTVQK